MSRLRHWLTLGLLSAAVAVPVLALNAASPPVQDPSTTQTAETPQAPAQAAEQRVGERPPAQPAAPAKAAAPAPIEEFIPTEKIEADSAVSFPVDI